MCSATFKYKYWGDKLGGYFTGPEKSYFLRNLVANRFAIFFLNSFPLRKKKKNHWPLSQLYQLDS